MGLGREAILPCAVPAKGKRHTGVAGSRWSVELCKPKGFQGGLGRYDGLPKMLLLCAATVAEGSHSSLGCTGRRP